MKELTKDLYWGIAVLGLILHIYMISGSCSGCDLIDFVATFIPSLIFIGIGAMGLGTFFYLIIRKKVSAPIPIAYGVAYLIIVLFLFTGYIYQTIH